MVFGYGGYFKKLFALSLLGSGLFSSVLFASQRQLTVDMSYHASNVLSHSLAQTAYYQTPLNSWLSANMGARLKQSEWDLSHLGYAAELQAQAFSFLSFHARLSHMNRLSHTISTTCLLGFMRLSFSPFSFVSFFASSGHYLRKTELATVTVVPVLFGESLSDHDFIGEWGFESTYGNYNFRLKVATFEEIEIFNLNNVFFEARLRYSPPNESFEYFLLSRYKFLLGFGHLDEVVLGAGLKWLI